MLQPASMSAQTDAALNASHHVRKRDRVGNRKDDHIPPSINARKEMIRHTGYYQPGNDLNRV